MKLFLFCILAFVTFFQVEAFAQSGNQQDKHYRRLFPELNWPEVVVSSGDFSGFSSEGVSNGSDVQATVLRACQKAAGAYKKELVKSSGVDIVGDYFTAQCRLIKSQLENGLKLDSAEAAQNFVTNRLDAFYMALVTTPGTSQAQLFQESVKSYNQSILGLAGVNFKSSFLVTQLLVMASLIFSLGAIFLRK